MNERHDDLQEIIDAALREMAAEEGDGFDPQACIEQIAPPRTKPGFERFDFGRAE